MPAGPEGREMGNGELLFNGCRVSPGGDGKVLEMEGGEAAQQWECRQCHLRLKVAKC